jgi:two-component system, OmpR family, response regulator ChvI
MVNHKKMGYTNINNKKKGRILVVDDEIDITFSLKILLEENGFEVYTFNKPSSILSGFRAGLYDLIILDIMMPEINGFNLYKKIREIDNKVHVLFLTALSDYSSYMQEPNESSFVLDEKNVIPKPVDNGTLLERIMTYLPIDI